MAPTAFPTRDVGTPFVRPRGARRVAAEQTRKPVVPLAPSRLTGVAVVDADPLTREGIRAIVEGQWDLRMVQESPDVGGLLAHARAAPPEVVLVEAGLAGEDAGAAVRALLRALPGTRVVAFGTGTREEEVFQIFAAGASGYVVRSAVLKDLPTSIRRARAGLRHLPPEVERCIERRQQRPRLTSRERTVLGLLAQARSNAGIAAVLGISIGTVKLHVKSVLAKLGVEDRAQAALVALERGLVSG